ncbi:helix-turn-helix domain-containing protein [Mucilaginibacter litoreus]|uniref:Helix-turn-helix domain-containing protein n=1 Tax=Mucilaginibacter litoreus TaxID=1048221 RepID=A0ABW3AMJ3_9SPHI
MSGLLPFQTMLSQEPLQVTRIRDYINPGSFVPHRHRFYMLLWITEGSGVHEVDFEALELLPGRVFPVSEGQVHKIVEPVLDGWMLTFSAPVFSGLMEGVGGIDAEEIFDQPFIDLNKEESANFCCLWALLQRTVLQNALSPMLINQLRVLLGCLLQCADQCKRVRSHGRNYPVLKELKRLIAAHYMVQPHADYYASVLDVPLWKLNAWCRESLGTNVAGLLAERTVLEAKALLTTTDRSVREITFMLGLEDPSNFAKVFRRAVGMSPHDYRLVAG